VPEVGKGLFQVGDETTSLSGLHNDDVDVDLQVAPDLPFETGLHTLLVGSPHVL
jgi:hypothetical protein